MHWVFVLIGQTGPTQGILVVVGKGKSIYLLPVLPVLIQIATEQGAPAQEPLKRTMAAHKDYPSLQHV